MASSKQYGLIHPKKASLPLKRPSIFDEDSDSNDAADMSQTDWIKKSYQKEAEKNYQKRAVKTQLDKAMEEDPSVFQYDEVYDDMQTKKVETLKAKKDVEKKPRYIQSLLAQAERRKRENEYRNERLIQKEREAEGEMYKDKETFVTSAYRKKLEEFKKLDEEERRQDMLEEIGDVTKQQDLSGFYRHLYESQVSHNDKKSKTAATEINSSRLSKSPSSVNDRTSPEVPKEIEESFPLSKEKTPSSSHYAVTGAASSKSRQYRKRKSSSSESETEEVVKHVVRRKRKSESTSEKSVDKNLDADTDLSSSSSSSGSSSSSSSSSSSESDNESEAGGVKKSNDADLTSGSEEGEIIESSIKMLKKESPKLDSVPSEKLPVESVKKEKLPEKESKPIKKEKEKETKAETKKSNKIKPETKELDEDKSETKKLHETKAAKEEKEKEEEVEEEKKIDIWEKRTVGKVFDDALKRYLERKAARLANRSG